MAASAEEQTATVTEVSDSADRLADQADELMGLLDRFEIADATDEKSSPDAVAGDD